MFWILKKSLYAKTFRARNMIVHHWEVIACKSKLLQQKHGLVLQQSLLFLEV